MRRTMLSILVLALAITTGHAAHANATWHQAVQSAATQHASGMESIIKAGATPAFVVLPKTPGVNLRQTQAANYGAGTHAVLHVENLPAGASLDLLSLLPVSGHVGLANATNYARTNQYNLVVVEPGGQQTALPKVPTTGFVTQKDLSLSLKPGMTRLLFWPDGSGGVGGYPQGRTIDLHYAPGAQQTP
jgi:hypothetical protein